ncbi:hypothetical protein [Bacillus alkalicellulosilyticus]|uniref:hypothetical protein n=1 Tax=Alkalihalobacterium alkalicellulosilyticum TaxID=1912214 RepID=UPI0009982163|nr:hypothetical protein [Bacillus alkalicellulosilyticus]
MKRYWLVTEGGQYAVYDSKEKTITNWVDQQEGSVEEIIMDIRNTQERHDEEIGDVEDRNGIPVIQVVGEMD